MYRLEQEKKAEDWRIEQERIRIETEKKLEITRLERE